MTTTHPIEFISTISPTSNYIVVVTKNGYVNKFSSVALSSKQRGQSGNQIIKLSKNDNIIAAYGACDTDVIQIWTHNGGVTVNVGEFPTGSSIGSGTRVLQGKTDFVLNCNLVPAKK